MLVTILLLIGPAIAPAQPPEASFEVATVKLLTAAGHPDFKGGPGTQDPTRVSWTNYPLKALIIDAFAINGERLNAPNWIDTVKCDVQAVVPAGTKRAQLETMLQGLLVERFHLAFHWENKRGPVYILTIARQGVTLRLAQDESVADSNPIRTVPKRGLGSDGFPQLEAHAGPPLILKMGARTKIMARRKTISEIAQILSTELGRPVIDQTNLKGEYDLSLFYASEHIQSHPVREGGESNSDLPDGPSLLDAVQSQLGLHLKPGESTVAWLVIDRLDKAPSAN